MENKFFTFFKPYFDYIDDGSFFRKPYYWFYTIFAVLNLLFPLVILVSAIDNHVFSFGGKVAFAFILVWIILALAAWVSFQLWWDRKSKVINVTSPGDDFVAIPVFAHLIQTFGEWLGTYIAIVGTLTSLLLWLILGAEGAELLQMLGVNFLGMAVSNIVVMPLFGLIIIGLFRFIAEQARALASIANNTKK
ncbi:MAG: hypothetical protein LBJ72_06155 [Dysgonamonadaceae bacterium]|jgi:hypothetical protein|nr:hypothetical protein [Dysgonamonadaceae bacterium]